MGLVAHILENMDAFAESYFAAVLFFGGQESEFDDKNCYDMHLGDLLRQLDECNRFQVENAADIAGWESQAGHDFYLTRCGMGAGFWDGDWPEEAGERLSAASRLYGSFDAYVGDDGKIYCT